MIQQLRCTITGIVIALVVTLLFNVSYYITFILIGNKDYALNAACMAVVIVLLSVVIDILRNINWHREKPIQSTDLIPKGFNTVQPPKEEPVTVQNTEQIVKKLEQLKEEPEHLQIVKTN